MSRRSRYSGEFRERAVRIVFDHRAEYGPQRAATSSIAAKVGCTAETLHGNVLPAEFEAAYYRQLDESAMVA